MENRQNYILLMKHSWLTHLKQKYVPPSIVRLITYLKLRHPLNSVEGTSLIRLILSQWFLLRLCPSTKEAQSLLCDNYVGTKKWNVKAQNILPWTCLNNRCRNGCGVASHGLVCISLVIHDAGIVFCAYWLLMYLLWRNGYSSPLLIF
jgi:hypothetical protein